MTNAEIILQFASSQSAMFLRRDLLQWVRSKMPSASVGSIDVTLRKLTNQGILNRVKNGIYKIGPNYKVKFSVRLDDESKSLYKAVRELYPYTKLCIWNANVISSFMQHIPNVNMIILETERHAMEALFSDLGQLSERHALLKPTEKEYSLYASGRPCIIVKPLISEAPLNRIDEIDTPSIEKILVDISIDPEFPYAREAELYSIFENVGEQYSVDTKCMLRYASRRGKKDKIQNLINSTIL